MGTMGSTGGLLGGDVVRMGGLLGGKILQEALSGASPLKT